MRVTPPRSAGRAMRVTLPRSTGGLAIALTGLLGRPTHEDGLTGELDLAGWVNVNDHDHDLVAHLNYIPYAGHPVIRQL